MISLVVSGAGAIVAAVGSGVLLARCFREPRGDVIAWSLALLGLLVSLGSQALGHLTGFDPAMFRGMEIGGQVIAPLALILGLSEIAAKSAGVRFCARLYLPALAIVAVVILALDQLAQASFSKAWPDPSVFYQLPPNYVLMFAIGPVTALVAVIAVLTVLVRSGQPGWNAVRGGQLLGGVAALALAYPCLAQLAAYVAGVHLPVSSEFAVLCTAAAGLTWMAGVRAGRRRLPGLQGQRSAEAASWDEADRFGEGEQSGEFGRLEPAAAQGLYREGGIYRPDREADDGWGSRDDPDGRYGTGYQAPDFATGDFATGDFAAGDFATGDFVADDLAVGDHDLGYPADQDRLADQDRFADQDKFSSAPVRAPAEAGRADMFGQIAIYTVLEDRVDDFDQLTERVVGQVRSREPDTLVFIVHAVPSAPMQRILYEVYRDRAAYQWHTEQPYVRQFEADRRPFVLATNVIELGLQQAKVSPFPSVSDLFGEPGYDTSGFERPDFLRDYGRTSGQPGGNGRREFG